MQLDDFVICLDIPVTVLDELAMQSGACDLLVLLGNSCDCMILMVCYIA